jgi:hypothetical protein
MNRPAPVTDEDIAKCIGEKATLYIQLGCHACETQEKLFGDNYHHLDIVDCFPYVPGKCDDIRVTPTWRVDDQLLEGVYSVERLQELTGCE